MGQPRWFGFGLAGLAVSILAVAALGPLVTGVVDYRYNETMLNQARGLDAFAALVVAPVAVAAAILHGRRHPAAPFVAMAPAVFTLYMIVQYVIGPEYMVVPGNGERFFPLFAATFILAGAVALQAWALAPKQDAWDARMQRRRGGGLCLLAAFVVLGLYLGNGFLDALRDFPGYVTERAGVSEYDDHPTAYWIVAFLDLAIVVPITLATGLSLLRGTEWARRAFYAVIGWFALVPGSVAAMAIVMVVRDDEAADPGRAVMFTVVAIVCSLLAFRTFQRLLRQVPPRAMQPL